MTLKVRILQFGGSNNLDQICSKKKFRPIFVISEVLASIDIWNGQKTTSVDEFKRQTPFGGLHVDEL